jgi:hypothetical protein
MAGDHTLRSIVEIIRTIMQADVASIFGFSPTTERLAGRRRRAFAHGILIMKKRGDSQIRSHWRCKP